MRKLFFVSRAFPWARVIYPGSGPSFGESYGWEVRGLDELADASCDAAIVENRLAPDDLPHLERHLSRPGGPPFPLFFKLSDPEMPLSTNEGVRYLLGQRDRPGVHYVSVYEPAGPVASFVAGLRRSRVARAPFPYDRRREVDRPLDGRARRVFLSGKKDRRLYPFREAMFRRHRWNPLARTALVRLRHPGYPDLGATARHDVIGAKFVERAATCTHFLLDPSRHGVELMKYAECAYAGSVPFGEVPGSLEDVVGAAFVRSAGRTLEVLRAVRRPIDELRAVASAYRDALRRARDPARLDAALDDALRTILLA